MTAFRRRFQAGDGPLGVESGRTSPVLTDSVPRQNPGLRLSTMAPMSTPVAPTSMARRYGARDGAGTTAAIRLRRLGAAAMGPVHGRRREHLAGWIVMAVLTVLTGCSTAPDRGRPGSEAAALTKSPGVELDRGRASWYGPGFHGKRTASGERFDMNDLTAAHRTLPFGTRVRVRNTQNGREVVVRINDRGPHISDRIIDLSKAAGAALGLLQAGEAPVVLIEL